VQDLHRAQCGRCQTGTGDFERIRLSEAETAARADTDDRIWKSYARDGRATTRQDPAARRRGDTRLAVTAALSMEAVACRRAADGFFMLLDS